MNACCDDDREAGPRDLRERLRVIAVKADSLVVAADRASACAACAEAKGCGTRVLASMSQSSLMTIGRPDGLMVAAGDEVDVSISGNSLLAGAGLAYLLPAVAFVVALSAATIAGLSDAGSAVVALIVLPISFLPVIFVERRARLAQALRVLEVYPAARDLPPQGLR